MTAPTGTSPIEPATRASSSAICIHCSSVIIVVLGGSERGRTSNPRFRRPVLYPLSYGSKCCGGERGIRTLGTGNTPYAGLANRCLQPLGHLSELAGRRSPSGRACQTYLTTCVT